MTPNPLWTSCCCGRHMRKSSPRGERSGQGVERSTMLTERFAFFEQACRQLAATDCTRDCLQLYIDSTSKKPIHRTQTYCSSATEQGLMRICQSGVAWQDTNSVFGRPEKLRLQQQLRCKLKCELADESPVSKYPHLAPCDPAGDFTHLSSGLYIDAVAHPPIRLGHKGTAAPAALSRCVYGSLSKSPPHTHTLMQHRCWLPAAKYSKYARSLA
eukprot:3401096-Pleurochrysis_carterae.AAC.1